MLFLKDKKWLLWVIIGALATIAIMTVRFFKMGKDNVIEQACEKIIEKKTGVKVDFTPEEKPAEEKKPE